MKKEKKFNIFRELPACMHPLFDNKMRRYFKESGKPFPVVVLSLSGGKDSTYVLLQALDQGLPIDIVLWFDTGWEFPEMYLHMEKIKKYLKKIRPEAVFVHLTSRNNFDGLVNKYMWPSGRNRFCTAEKLACIRRFYSQYIYKHGYEVIEVIGYAADEEERMAIRKSKKGHKKIWTTWFPMSVDEWNVSEEEALKYCYQRGFDWSGLYDLFHRVSCYKCPQSSKDELRVLRQKKRDLWGKMLAQEKTMPAFLVKAGGKIVKNTFKWGMTLHEIDEMFAKEESSLLFAVQYTKKIRKPTKGNKDKKKPDFQGKQLCFPTILK